MRAFLAQVRAVPTAALLIVVAGALQATAACPAPAEIPALAQHHIETVYWSPTERDNWQVGEVGNFEFGAIKVGKPVQKRVHPDRPPLTACPVRILLGYTITHRDGRLEGMGGTPRTYWFYRDPFGDWAALVD